MCRIVLTRPLQEAAALAQIFSAAGCEPILFPSIEIHPVVDNPAWQRAVRLWPRWDWVIFTSANAVQAVCQSLPARDDFADRAFPRIAAIGTKTAAALARCGLNLDFVPAHFVSEEILPALGDLRGRWVLYPAADIARQSLPWAIVQAGGMVHQITVYRTRPAAPRAEGVAAVRAGVDWLSFTSPSTVRNFCSLTVQAGLNPLALPGAPKVACIGPVTAAAARGQGFHVDVIAEPHTAEGLAAAIFQKIK